MNEPWLDNGERTDECGDPLNRIEADAEALYLFARVARERFGIGTGELLLRISEDHEAMLGLLRDAEAIIASACYDSENIDDHTWTMARYWAERAEKLCGWPAFWKERNDDED